MAKNEEKRITVKSVLNATLIHGLVKIEAFEILSVNEELAKELIATGYVKEVKTKEV
jgi:hypothetical protein